MKRLLIALLLLVLAIPVAAVGAAHFLLNEDAIRAGVADAVRRATGRELAIAGPIQLAWSLAPTIEARDVSLLNPPGMSRAATARADRVEAQIALLPLLARRLELRRLRVVAPDILLERDAAGRPNWLLTRPQPVPSGVPSAPAGPDRRFQVQVGTVAIEQARVAWRGGGVPLDLAAPQIGYAPDTGRVEGTLTANGVPVSVAGRVDGAGVFGLDLVGGGLAAHLAGATAAATLTVLAPDLAALAGLVGRPLPPLRDVKLTAALAATGLSQVRLQAGASQLGPVQLISLEVTAPALTEPVAATAEVSVGRLPVSLTAHTGALSTLFGTQPREVQATAVAGDARLSVQGTISAAGVADMTLTGTVPDLLKAGWLAGAAVPPLHNLAIETRLATSANTLLVRGLRLTAAEGDLAGDLALGWQNRPSLRGSVVSQRLDLNAWLSPVPPPGSAPAVSGPAASPPSPSSPSTRLLPTAELPFASLRQADADLHVAIGEAAWHGAALRAVDARAVIADGRLQVDPFSAQVGDGALHAQVRADAAAENPTLAVTARGAGLQAGPVLAAFGAPETTKGALDVDLQLSGRGRSVAALAASLDGHLGLAVVDGEVENRWLEQLASGALRAANVPMETGGTSRVRCAAIRADAAAGQVAVRTLALDTTRLKLDGEGGLDLRDETLNLHLRPQLRLGTALSLPVRVSGTFRSPKLALDPGAIAPGRVGITIGGPAPPDTCGPALAAARDGQPGAAPTGPETPTRAPRPADFLRGLLR